MSYNDPYFLKRNIATTNFLIPHTCEVRFHDVTYRSTEKYSYANIPKHGCPSQVCVGPFFLIQLAGFRYVLKRIWHSLTSVIKIIKLVLKNVI